MSASVWVRLEQLDAPDTVEARRQLHHAVQLLTSFCGTHLEERPDDLHRSLCWEAAAGGFVTGAPAAAPDARVELGIADLELRVRRCEELDVLELEGRTLSEARAWLRDRVADRMGLEGGMSAPEFEIPSHPVGEGAPFDPPTSGLERLARLYHDAALVLAAHAAQARHPHRGVRCWPHHFDIAVLFEVGRREDGTRCTVGVGMAPFDGSTETPYWYVTPYPYDFDAELAELDAGRWSTDGWLGAILDTSEVAGADRDAQHAAVCAWLARAAEAAADTLDVDLGLDDPDSLRVPGALR